MRASSVGAWRMKDTYCLFCGCMVETRMRMATKVSDDHGMRCALMYLAGMIEAVKPGTRRPPAGSLDLDFDTVEQPGLFQAARS